MEIKEKLLTLFKEILGMDDISETSNIFDMGGSSLTIYKISEQAKERYGLKVNPIDIMTYPTLEKLCLFLEEGTKQKSDDDKITARKNLRNRRRREEI